jgi:alkylated DNA repair dioxygenase AlkB
MNEILDRMFGQMGGSCARASSWLMPKQMHRRIVSRWMRGREQLRLPRTKLRACMSSFLQNAQKDDSHAHQTSHRPGFIGCSSAAPEHSRDSAACMLSSLMRQQDLFSREETSRIEIPGFCFRIDYITPEEERTLLEHVSSGPWESDFRRRIQQYGFGYSAAGGTTPVWIRDFPDWLLPLAHRVQEDAPLERLPENCVINEYLPPLGIGPHRDYNAFGPTVACVSLGSDIVIDFTHPKEGWRVPVHVPARSFWVITGDARSVWTHGIAARLNDVIDGERRKRQRRVSITFRTAKSASRRQQVGFSNAATGS